jgi:RecB family exonuclease
MAPPMTLDVLLGLALDGARVTELDDLAEGESRVGTLVVGPHGLLRDLELRLGLTADDTPPPVRVARYARRLEAVAKTQPAFWAGSFGKDPLGTARELLRWRDELVLSGWNGQPVPMAGRRMEALAAVEVVAPSDTQPDLPALPAGPADRWASVASLLTAGGRVPYTGVRVVDPIALLPRRIRDVLARLAAQGSAVTQVTLDFPVPGDNDLGRLQRHFRQGGAPFEVTGDGTLLFVEAETATDLAGATAALLAQRRGEASATVARLADPSPLDHALRAAGLATQGLSSSSPLRPCFQVLPLVLELAYEPKDPHRVLELLTLPGGPFAGGLGRGLAEAFAGRPGLGNDDWEEAKQEWATSVRKRADPPDEQEDEEDTVEVLIATRLSRLAEWVEAPGSTDPRAPRSKLVEIVARVQKWLAGRAMHASLDDPEQAALAAQAHVQAATLVSTLSADPRLALTIVEIRQLFAEALGGGYVTQLPEEAGRIDHVSDLAALLRPRDTLVLWGAVDMGGLEPPSPWTPGERTALASAGIELPDAAQRLAFRAEAARRALLFTTGRVIFARPLSQLGKETAPHPLLDEVIARLGNDRAALARITVTTRTLLESKAAEALPTLPLPAPRPEWSLDQGVLARREHLSPSSIEMLIACPLRFVLEKEAGLREAQVISMPEDRNLFGTVGHRLVEKLHQQKLLGCGTRADRARLRSAAETTLDLLLRQEATPLLVVGRSGDRAQYRSLIVDSVVALDDLLRRSKLTVVSVEQEIEIEWDGRTLEGRLDLLLNDSDGRDVVLDLKWGSKTYAEKLEAGVAIQLSTYAFVRRKQNKARRLPESAYYALRKGEALALSNEVFADARVIDGPGLDLTWKRTAASIAAVEEDLAAGRIAVPHHGPGDPAWRSRARAKANPEDFVPLATDAACEYCSLDATCGKRWVAINGGDE